MRILLIEVEPAQTLRGALERERFIVDYADRLAVAREAAVLAPYNLILLDRTLPDGDGLSLIPILRAEHPGLCHHRAERAWRSVRSRDRPGQGRRRLSHQAVLAGRYVRASPRRPATSFRFSWGGDPCRSPRLRTRQRRGGDWKGSARAAPSRTARIGDLDETTWTTVLRETLEQAVYGFDDEVPSNALDSHVSRLRRKLAEAEAGVEIHPIRGIGYLLRKTS